MKKIILALSLLLGSQAVAIQYVAAPENYKNAYEVNQFNMQQEQMEMQRQQLELQRRQVEAQERILRDQRWMIR